MTPRSLPVMGSRSKQKKNSKSQRLMVILSRPWAWEAFGNFFWLEREPITGRDGNLRCHPKPVEALLSSQLNTIHLNRRVKHIDWPFVSVRAKLKIFFLGHSIESFYVWHLSGIFYPAECSGVITVDAPMLLKSPSYPNKYPSGLRCRWILKTSKVGPNIVQI